MPGMTESPGVILTGMPALTLLLEAPAEVVLQLGVLGTTRIAEVCRTLLMLQCASTLVWSRLAPSLPSVIRSKMHKRRLILRRD